MAGEEQITVLPTNPSEAGQGAASNWVAVTHRGWYASAFSQLHVI